MQLEVRRRVAIWSLVGFAVPFFWGIVSFAFFSARESRWTTLYWYLVYATCPSWLLPETDFSWVTTPLLNALFYGGVAYSICTVKQNKGHY